VRLIVPSLFGGPSPNGTHHNVDLRLLVPTITCGALTNLVGVAFDNDPQPAMFVLLLKDKEYLIPVLPLQRYRAEKIFLSATHLPT
jgi:hypothetical protein